MSRLKFPRLLRAAPFAFPIAFLLILATGTVKLYRIPTKGMSPTIEAGDYVFSTRNFNPAKKVNRGDVVVFDATRANPTLKGKYVQRVIALGGDRIEWDGDTLRVNGEALPERATLKPQRASGPLKGAAALSYPLQVPADSVFTLGDNYGNSLDSRYFGPFPIEAVTHSPHYIVTPLSRARKVE